MNPKLVETMKLRLEEDRYVPFVNSEDGPETQMMVNFIVSKFVPTPMTMQMKITNVDLVISGTFMTMEPEPKDVPNM